jgi:hypothetical protein
MKYVKYTSGLYFSGEGGEVSYFHADCHAAKNAREDAMGEAAFGKRPNNVEPWRGEVIDGDPPLGLICAWCGKPILPEQGFPEK